MLRWRLLLGTLLVAALVGLCWLDGRAAVAGIWLMPVVVVAAVLATKEVLDLLAAAGMKPVRWLVYLANLAIVLGTWMTHSEKHPPESTTWAFLLTIFFAEMVRYRKPGGVTGNVAGGLLAFLYVGVMLQCAVLLRLSFGIGAVAAWIFVVKMGDTGAYAVGRLVGRRKMAPYVSPGKTIEGAIGAMFFSILASWIAFDWLIPACSANCHRSEAWWGWLVFGLVVGAAGMLGDLAESLLKRDVGRKDSSDWLPGFGGVLDILDSLLLSAPVAWFCWAFGLVGR
jgi:phosphatidate cytidylyltransferase